MSASIRSWVWFSLRLTIGLCIVGYFVHTVDPAGLMASVGRVDTAWLLFAFALTVAGSIVGPAFITRRALLIGRIQLSLRELIAINFSMRFYTLVLPRAASLGIRWYRYSQRGSGHDALALLFFERLIQILVVAVVPSFLLAWERQVLGDAGIYLWLVSLVAMLLVGCATVPFIFPATIELFNKLKKSVSHLDWAVTSRRMEKFLDAVVTFHRLPTSAIIQVVALSMASYILFILSAYVLAESMQMGVSLLSLAWIRSLVFLMTLVPFTVGGVGVRELGFIGMLRLYDVPDEEALAFSLVVFSVQVMVGIVGAALEVWRGIGLSSQSRAEKNTSSDV